jgi:hypothetical protein
LHRAIAELKRVARASPWLEFRRRREASIAFGRFGVRDAFENADAAFSEPANFSAVSFDFNMLRH